MANQDFAQLVFFVALLIVLASIVFASTLRPMEIIRGVATWLAIVLILVAGYAYRIELAGVGGRVLGMLAPGEPISGTLAGESDPDAVVIVRAAAGHFAVRAAVEGKPVTFLVDTGASYVTLTYADAAAIGIDAGRLAYDMPIRTANGPTTAASIVIDRIAVGSIARSRIEALVAPKGALDESLLGMTFLDTLKGYAIAGDRLVMRP